MGSIGSTGVSGAVMVAFSLFFDPMAWRVVSIATARIAKASYPAVARVLVRIYPQAGVKTASCAAAWLARMLLIGAGRDAHDG